MFRTILFLVLIGLVSLGAAWIADQHGDVSLVWNGWRIKTSAAVAALGFAVAVVLAMLAWAVLRGMWRLPGYARRRRHERRHLRGRHAITHGLLAIGTGNSAAALKHAQAAKRHAADDPLTLLLHAQAAQLSGDRTAAQQAFLTMTERADTRLLGLRGLFVEAQRNDDPVAAVAIAEEALKLTREAAWASHAVLGFRCASGDWTGALSILERDNAAGAIDKALYTRQRAVLLTARAIESETSNRDAARADAMEAVRLAPTLVPAAVLAAKFLSEQQQIRKAMRVIEAAWRANPHPDLADAYAHVRLGDSAQQRLARVQSLAAKAPDSVEGALATARAAIDAGEFAKARKALEPLLASPTQRVSMLMAELARAADDDDMLAREWTLRAVRARHDPAWTADGYISDRWRPVSPVTGRLDAFQWVTPVAALDHDKAAAIEPSRDALQPRRVVHAQAEGAKVAPPGAITHDLPDTAHPAAALAEAQPGVAGAGAEPAVSARTSPLPETATHVPPVFRRRAGLDRATAAAPHIPQVIPIMRAPDDPGIEDDEGLEEESEPRPLRTQQDGWRGFLARWVG